MTLGRRCDEIVRIIDETLMSMETESGPVIDVSAHPSGASLAGRGIRPLEVVGGRRRRTDAADLRLSPGGGARRPWAGEARGDAGGRGRDRSGGHRSAARLRALHDDGIADL